MWNIKYIKIILIGLLIALTFSSCFKRKGKSSSLGGGGGGGASDSSGGGGVVAEGGGGGLVAGGGASDPCTITISPTSVVVSVNRTRTFSNTSSGSCGAITYSVSVGTGTVAADGVYTAPAATGTATVRASDGTVNSDASVTIIQAAKIVTGEAHSCARFNDNRIRCWGDNTYGQLGIASSDTSPHHTPSSESFVSLGTGLDAKDIFAGAYHTCAVLNDTDVSDGDDTDKVKCWGRNNNGQLGIGSLVDQNNPSAVAILDFGTDDRVNELALGAFHTCARIWDNTIRCWGSDTYGQLGNGSAGDFTSPQTSASGSLGSTGRVDLGSSADTANRIAAGGYHTCAIRADTYIRCWGRDNNGQVGNGGSMSSAVQDDVSVPLPSGADTASAIALGGYHSCAIRDTDSRLFCWGRDSEGQVGNNATLANQASAVTVASLGSGRTVTSIALGGHHTCARLDDNSVKCWGRNTNGQLGMDSVTDQAIPPVASIDLGSGRSASSIAASSGDPDAGASNGSQVTCAVLDNNTVKCWGFNNQGQLGQGDTASRGDAAGEMAALSSINL